MKKEQILERNFFGATVRQRTSDGYISLNDLFDAYNKKHNVNKRIDHYLEPQSTKEFIFTIAKNEFSILDILNTRENRELKSDDQIVVSQTVSQMVEGIKGEVIPVTKLPYETRRGKYNGGTWAHPYLFTHAALWLSSEFSYYVIKFLHENVVEFRILACEDYKEMTASLRSLYVKNHNGIEPNTFVYINEIQKIKSLVYINGDLNKERNKSSLYELKMLDELQKLNTLLCNDGIEKQERYKQLEYHAKLFRRLYPQNSTNEKLLFQ